MKEPRRRSFRPGVVNDLQVSEPSPASAGILAVVGLLLAGVLVAACEGRDTPELSPEREAAVAETIHSLVTVGPYPDPEPYLQLYSDNAPFYSEGSRLSRSEHEAAVHEHVSVPSRVEVQASEPEVEVLGPRAAVASILLRGHVTDTAGERREVSGAITQVYELRDGQWKVVQAHESFSPPEE